MANTIPSAMYSQAVRLIQEAMRAKAGVLVGVTLDTLPDGVADTSKVGDTVTVEIPPIITAGTVTPAITAPALPNNTYKSKDVTLATFSNAMFHFTGQEWAALERGELVVSRSIESAMEALLVPIRSGIFTVLKPGIQGYVKSTTGTSMFNATDGLRNLSSVVGVLDKQKCPRDRVAILANPEVVEARGLQQFTSGLYAPAASAARVYGEGLIGRIFGLDVLQEDEVANIPATHTAGTGASYAVDGNHAAGATSILTKSGSGTVLAGDMITINNFDYVVKTGITAHGQSIVLPEPGLLEAASASATITVRDASSTHSIRGYAICPRNVLFVNRTPRIRGEAGDPAIITDPVTGLRLKLAIYGGYHAAEWELSILWGAGVANARAGCRLVV
jgi:hypothetical protein